MKTRGVYILANDSVKDLIIAFLESFRVFNPKLPICLIPYDNDFSIIQELKSKFDFSIFGNTKLLSICDNISRLFYPNVVGEFRKLVAWFGPFDEFVYIDIDTIVLYSFDFIFAYLKLYPLINSHSNIESSRKFTWKESILSSGRLDAKQIAYSANMGFFASRLGVFDLLKIQEAANEAVAIKEHMELLCTDQPFMNFLFVTSGKEYASLHELRNFDATLPHEAWAGDPNWIVSENFDAYYAGEKKSVLFVHWAGVWKAKDPPTKSPVGHNPLNEISSSIRPNLPMKELWLRFRTRFAEQNTMSQANRR